MLKCNVFNLFALAEMEFWSELYLYFFSDVDLSFSPVTFARVAGRRGDQHAVAGPQHEDVWQDPVYWCQYDVRGSRAENA